MNGSNTSEPNCSTVAQELAKYGIWTGLPAVQVIFGLLFGVVSLLGITGNVLVLVAIWRHKSLQTVRNIFITNLSVSDLAVSLAIPINAYNSITLVWIFGGFLCHLINLLMASSVLVSALTLACIAIDRFILLVFIHRRPISKEVALSMISVVWLLAVVAGIPSGIASELKSEETNCGATFCMERWKSYTSYRAAYGWILVFSQYILPFLIIFTCYTCIIIRLNRSAMMRRHKDKRAMSEATPLNPSGPASNVSSMLAIAKQKNKSTADRRFKSNQMQIAMVSMFGISQLPQVLFNVTYDMEILQKTVINDQIYFWGMVVLLIACTSAIWNPFLYGFMNNNFRTAFVGMARSCLPTSERAPASDRPRRSLFSVVDQNRLRPAFDTGPEPINHDHDEEITV